MDTISQAVMEDFAKRDTVRIMASLNKDVMLKREGKRGGKVREARSQLCWQVPKIMLGQVYRSAIERIRIERNTWGINWQCFEIEARMGCCMGGGMLHFKAKFQKVRKA